MNPPAGPATLDTNIAIYAVTSSPKQGRAADVLGTCAFLSVQVLNEFANVSRRKRGRSWSEVGQDLRVIRSAIPETLPITAVVHDQALRIAARYRLSFYDALMLAAALSGGASTFYSEDMHHDLVIDGTLRVLDPFRPGTFA